MNIKNLRKQTKMTQQQFSEYFNIPKRTIEDWESEKRTPPEYVVCLIKYKLKNERLIEAAETLLDIVAKKIKEIFTTLAINTFPDVIIKEATFFDSKTITMSILSDCSEIIINESYIDTFLKNDFFLTLCIAHEARHVWQLQTNFIKDYKTRKKVNFNEYNSQKAEIDAWAWACLYTSEKFDAMSILENLLDEEIIDLIYDRMDEIEEDIN